MKWTARPPRGSFFERPCPTGHTPQNDPLIVGIAVRGLCQGSGTLPEPPPGSPFSVRRAAQFVTRNRGLEVQPFISNQGAGRGRGSVRTAVHRRRMGGIPPPPIQRGQPGLA